MSGAFQTAWAVLKMARYRAGPYEIWDSNERYYNKERDEQFGHLPKTAKRGGTEFKTNYPLGANLGYEFNAGKAMMTPEQFHQLVAGPAPEHRTGQQKGILDLMNQGAPIAAPFLKLGYDGDGNLRVESHEGRHRMQALRDAGYGDTKVPIEIQGGKYGLGYDMTDEKLREAVLNSTIYPEFGYGKGYTQGERLHPLNQPLKIDNIDPIWTQGEYR